MQKFIDGRIVKCLLDDSPAVAYLHAIVLLFGGGPSPTDAFPVCDYHVRLFIRGA